MNRPQSTIERSPEQTDLGCITRWLQIVLCFIWFELAKTLEIKDFIL